MINPTVTSYLESVRNGHSNTFILDLEFNLISVISSCIQGHCSIHELIELLNLIPPENIFNRLHPHINNLHTQIQAQRYSETDQRRLCKEIDACLYILFEINGKCLNDFGQLLRQVTPAILSINANLKLFSMGLRGSFLKGIALIEVCPNLMQILSYTDTEDKSIFDLITYALSKEKFNNVPHSIEKIIKTTLNLKTKDVLELARDLRRSNVSLSDCSTPKTKKYLRTDYLIAQIEDNYRINTPDPDKVFAQLLVFSYANLVDRRFLLWIYAHKTELLLDAFRLDLLLGLFGYDAPIIWRVNKNCYLNNNLTGVETPSKYNSLVQYFGACLNKWSKVYLSSRPKGNDNALVSVLMTTLNPDIELLGLSVRSVLQQSHAVLELIIIDDSSLPDTSVRIKALVDSCRTQYRKDIIYHKNPETLGQYVSRNIAIGLSKGSFIAVQDDDDISHPLRIRIQLDKMLDDPELVAVQTMHLRFSQQANILIDGNKFGDLFGDSLVSFMWRSKVFEEIGVFSPLKSRGDVDFRTRLLNKYGESLLYTINIPLVLMRGDYSTVSSLREYYYRTAVRTIRKVIDMSSTHPPSILDNVIPYNLR
jgi:hypothetical protein